jgi:hypothetical protein
MVLEHGNWTKEVQKALTIPPSLKGDAKEMEQTPFNLLCQKASKWIQYLSDIRKLENKFNYFDKRCWGEDEYEDVDLDEVEDEDEKQRLKQEKEQMQKEKQSALDKAERMIQIMGEIAVDIGIPTYIEHIQAFYYDKTNGTNCRRIDGSRFYVKVEHPSDAQKKLSPFAYLLAHPSPEELSITS